MERSKVANRKEFKKMNKDTIINYTIAILRIYISLVFILSGLEKINDLNGFAQSIENYKILPIAFVNIFAIIIPWIEVVTGALLLLGISIKENSLILLVLLLIFTIALIIALAKGLNINCGCQGSIYAQRISIAKILENISLIIISFVGIKYPRQKLTFLNSSRL